MMDSILTGILKELPVAAVLFIALKWLATQWKTEREYGKEQDLKNLKTLIEVGEYLKQHSVESREMTNRLNTLLNELNILKDGLENKRNRK